MTVRHKGRTLDVVDGVDIIDCDACGFTHVRPMPTVDELDAFYRTQYYTVDKPNYLAEHRADVFWWNRVYADRFDSFEEMLGSGRRSLLDVGSGPGFFLLYGKERGWDVTGLEPSEAAADHARGLGVQVIGKTLRPESVKELGRYDVVHMSEVLEHLPDPASSLETARALLKPGGLVCLMVPNDFTPVQDAARKAYGLAPWWIVPRHHLNYFNPGSLRGLLERTGFEVVLAEGTFPIDLFLLMGDVYVGNPALGRQCHGRRMTLERNLVASGHNDLKRQLYRDLLKAGIGREIVMYGRARP